MNKRHRLFFALGSVAVYMLAFVLTWPFEGDVAGMWAILPAVTFGWFLGMPAALAFGLLSIPSNILLFGFVASPVANLLVYHLVGGTAYATIGLATGWGKRVVDQSREQTRQLEHERLVLREEITKRMHVEEALQNAKDDLETIVRERTGQLKQTNDQLQVELTERKRAEEAVAEERSLLRTLIDNIPDYIYVKDSGGRFVIANSAVVRQMGFESQDELVGKSDVDVFPRELATRYYADEQAIVHSGQGLYNHEGPTVDMNKEEKNRWVSTSKLPLRDPQGKMIGFVGVGRDITKLKQAEEALMESEERYALATRGANDGLWDWNLKTNTLYYSSRWKSIFGYSENEIGASPDEWFTRVHPEDVEQLRTKVSYHLEGHTTDFQGEYRMRHKDGTYLWVLSRGLAVRGTDGAAYRMAGSISDITSRKRAEEQIIHDALHDALTGLPNRSLFMDRLGRVFERTKRLDEKLFTVLYLDFDRFKLVNDSLGHAVGDQLLIASARRLELCLRSIDTVARFGGDEFVILLEDIACLEEAMLVTERIQSELALPYNLNGHQVFNSVSIGIVMSTPDYDNPEEILRDADTAMYSAKALGRGHHAVFDRTMRDQAMTRLDLETDLRMALERQEFFVDYQPIVSLETRGIIGFEALVRWLHPSRGVVAPAEFIPAAEETGLIIPIDQWVLRESCRQMRKWQEELPMDPPLTISVNLSAKHFGQPDLAKQIALVLQETGLDACSLKLELTESMIVEDSRAVSSVLSELGALGVQVQIDDFGTGYSSLGYLHRLPIDTLKIDRTFISKMGMSGNGSEIVRTILVLAHDLGMKVIAEGVETLDQLTRLRGLECEYGQGFLFAKPVDKTAAAALIAELAAVA